MEMPMDCPELITRGRIFGKCDEVNWTMSNVAVSEQKLHYLYIYTSVYMYLSVVQTNSVISVFNHVYYTIYSVFDSEYHHNHSLLSWTLPHCCNHV